MGVLIGGSITRRTIRREPQVWRGDAQRKWSKEVREGEGTAQEKTKVMEDATKYLTKSYELIREKRVKHYVIFFCKNKTKQQKSCGFIINLCNIVMFTNLVLFIEEDRP